MRSCCLIHDTHWRFLAVETFFSKVHNIYIYINSKRFCFKILNVNIYNCIAFWSCCCPAMLNLCLSLTMSYFIFLLSRVGGKIGLHVSNFDKNKCYCKYHNASLSSLLHQHFFTCLITDIIVMLFFKKKIKYIRFLFFYKSIYPHKYFNKLIDAALAFSAVKGHCRFNIIGSLFTPSSPGLENSWGVTVI